MMNLMYVRDYDIDLVSAFKKAERKANSHIKVSKENEEVKSLFIELLSVFPMSYAKMVDVNWDEHYSKGMPIVYHHERSHSNLFEAAAALYLISCHPYQVKHFLDFQETEFQNIGFTNLVKARLFNKLDEYNKIFRCKTIGLNLAAIMFWVQGKELKRGYVPPVTPPPEGTKLEFKPIIAEPKADKPYLTWIGQKRKCSKLSTELYRENFIDTGKDFEKVFTEHLIVNKTRIRIQDI
jgi:hypothetical protein